MKIIRTLLIISVFALTSLSSFAQVKGKIIATEDDNPVEFANLAFLAPSDSSVVSGGMTDLDGSFEIEGIPLGTYILRISFVGFETKYQTVEIASSNSDLGEISLTGDAQLLEEVVIEAAAPLFESDINKRTFNVSNSIIAEGGSATDILNTIPSISVDQDGGIALRGSGSIMVLIDGKPSSLTGDDRDAILEQLPANIIEKVEVITNPSAKYDAEGVGGIINIILKKNNVQGFNGSANFSVGTRNKYNGGLNLNYRVDKFNFFAGYSYRYNDRFRLSESRRSNTNFDRPTYLEQNTDGNTISIDHVIRAGFDYTVNDFTSFGFSAVMNTDERKQFNSITSRTLDFNRQLDSLWVRTTNENRNNNNFEINGNFTHKFDKDGQELSVIASYSESDRTELEFFEQNIFNEDLTSAGFPPFIQQNTRLRDNSFSVIQADYVLPFGEDSRFETGYRGTLRKTDRDQLFENFDNEEESFFRDNNLSNRFIFNENVHALYAIYTNQMKRFGYQFGLRAEQTFTNSKSIGEEGQSVIPFSNNYGNLFPSVFLSYELGVEEDFQINYSRRIRRPGIWNLNPFVDNSDPLNIRFGNPELNPEFTDSYEMSYLKGWDKLFLTSSVFYRNTTGVIQRVIEVSENNISSVTFDNLDRRTAFGVEFINRYTPNDNWDATLTYNLFRQEIVGNNVNTNFNNANISYSVNLLSNFKIPNILDLQVQGNYQGPIALAQGILKERYSVDVGVRKEVLNKKAVVSLNISDIFNTRVYEVETSGPGFEQWRLGRRESRIGTLTFTYRFGGFREDGDGRRSRADNDSLSENDF